MREAIGFGGELQLQNISPAKGTLADALSFIRLDPQELVLTAVKRSEDKSGIIVRFVNMSNRTVKGVLSTHRPLQRVDLVSMNEELVEPLLLEGDAACSLPVTPKKIISLKLIYR